MEVKVFIFYLSFLITRMLTEDMKLKPELTVDTGTTDTTESLKEYDPSEREENLEERA